MAQPVELNSHYLTLVNLSNDRRRPAMTVVSRGDSTGGLSGSFCQVQHYIYHCTAPFHHGL